MKVANIASNMTEVETAAGVTLLFSYKTPVAAHVPDRGYLRTSKRWSATTSRHINKWLAMRGAHTPTEVDQSELDALA